MTPAQLLTNWVRQKHKGQLIKCTSKPYFNHLLAVAEMGEAAVVNGYEIGLCHDLFEETETTETELLQTLINFGYTADEAKHITNCVIELTDVYTSQAFPLLSKKARKKQEVLRLTSISADAQTVKYCDLIYNIDWMLRYKPEKARQYLKKKKKLLNRMTDGDAVLHQKVLAIINNQLDKG